MNCEYCQVEHDGKYGSGRFCSKPCASAFSTKEKRHEINKIVSKKLKGKRTNPNGGFRSGKEWNGRPFTTEDRRKGAEAVKRKFDEIAAVLPFEKWSKERRRESVLNEQHNKCLWCHRRTWNKKPLTLEIDHIDGDDTNNVRSNLRALCPNCHSQTPTYRKQFHLR